MHAPDSTAGSRRFWRWLALLLAFAVVMGCAAESDHTADRRLLTSSVQYWIDTDGSALPEQALVKPLAAGGFAPIADRGMTSTNFSFQYGAVWLRLPPQAWRPSGAAPERGWVLEVDYPPLDHVALSVFGGNGQLLLQQASGDKLPFASRPMPYRGMAFSLPGSLPADATLLLRIQSGGVLTAPVLLHTAEAFAERLQNGYALLGGYFGLLIGLVGYNLFLLLMLRDVRFGWYVLFTASVGVLQAALSGMGMQYLWPSAVWWQSSAAALTIAASAGFGVQFARSFLASVEHMPRIDVAMRMFLWFAALNFALGLFMPLRFTTELNSVLALAGVGLIFSAAVLGVMRRLEGAVFFLAAWAALLIGAVALTGHNRAWFPTNVFTAYGVLIGSAIEMVMLALALGHSVRATRDSRDLALRLAAQEHTLAESLRASEAQNTALLDERDAILNNTVVGMVLSIRREHAWVNAKFAQMMGYTREEMIGRNSQYLYADPEEWSRFGPLSRRMLEETGSFQGDVALRRKDGSILWAHMAASCLQPGYYDAGVIWSILDVTALKSSEEQTRLALEEQRKLTDIRERFAAMTSHELRTPVASILSTLELLEHYKARLSAPEKDELMGQIHSAAQRLWDMTERVLLHGKAQAGKLTCSPVQLDLPELLASVVADVLRDPRASAARLQQDLAPDLGVVVADPILLRHIVGNLLTNAFKYSPEGGEVRFGVQRVAFAQAAAVPVSGYALQHHGQSGRGSSGLHAGDWLLITVRDAGIGIPADALPSLFESFQRADNVGDISGTGLGLAIVKHCVLAHGAQLGVSSEVGAFTQFEVRIPLP